MSVDVHAMAWHELRLKKAADALRRNGFTVEVLADGAAAGAWAVAQAAGAATVGLGGSQTVRALGIPDLLVKSGVTVFTHTPEMERAERLAVWRRAQHAAVYFASPQAVSLEGELYFLDAYGNRAGAVVFGPGRVVLLAGRNKLVRDASEARSRVRDVAAVTNNIRLKRPNPCVTAGECRDCAAASRICNVQVVLHKRPEFADIRIGLVNDDLGF